MNEQILEIAKQAGLKFQSETDLSAQEKKFAELIVRECINIVSDAVNHREPASTYVDKIRNHFKMK